MTNPALDADEGCVFEADIEFNNAVIGKHLRRLTLQVLISVIMSNARTFGMLHEVQAMHAAGLALAGHWIMLL